MKVGRNEPCPCGSGRKFKKCCGDALLRPSRPYTAENRHSAFVRLDAWIDAFAEEEAEAAHELFWGRFIDDVDELPEHLAMLSQDAEDLWFAFDCVSNSGGSIVDALLAEAELGLGERAFLTALRQSTMRLYEIVDAVPGVSLTLRDAIEGGQITVNERRGSREMRRHMFLAARVVPCGPSGGPELEAGVLPIPDLLKDEVIAQIRVLRARFLDEHRGAPINDFYKGLPPFFHDVWAGSFLDAQVPTSKVDGEDLVPTTVEFDIVDADSLARALDGRAELERNDVGWTWSDTGGDGKLTMLGTIEHRGERLVLEAMTAERAARGRALLEAAAGASIRHRATVHESLQRAVKDWVRAKFLRGEAFEDDEDAGEPFGGLSPATGETLVLAHYTTYYRTWIDEPVPALDGATPREAARNPKLRERTIDLVNGLVAMYQSALRMGAPAYDPSWMWTELGLDDDAARHPPPLAYERIASAVAGSGELARTVAERIRKKPDFDEAHTVFSRRAETADLEIQRFLRGEGIAAVPYLRMLIDHELHRRKTFWVDESLAYMLDQTELDEVGSELRVQFPAFALAFTYRHELSYA
jgi:hypothetical protein